MCRRAHEHSCRADLDRALAGGLHQAVRPQLVGRGASARRTRRRGRRRRPIRGQSKVNSAKLGDGRGAEGERGHDTEVPAPATPTGPVEVVVLACVAGEQATVRGDDLHRLDGVAREAVLPSRRPRPRHPGPTPRSPPSGTIPPGPARRPAPAGRTGRPGASPHRPRRWARRPARPSPAPSRCSWASRPRPDPDHWSTRRSCAPRSEGPG